MKFGSELKLPKGFSLSKFQSDKIIVQIFLLKNIDMYNCTELLVYFKMLQKAEINKVIVNCMQLQYIDSSGIGVIIQAVKNYRKMKGDIALIKVPKEIKEVFKLIRLERFISMFEKEKDAMDYLNLK